VRLAYEADHARGPFAREMHLALACTRSKVTALRAGPVEEARRYAALAKRPANQWPFALPNDVRARATRWLESRGFVPGAYLLCFPGGRSVMPGKS
jgi:hypothetical protein